MKEQTTSAAKIYERLEIINILVKRVNALKKQYRQNIAIIGHQSLGKTSLIFDVLHRCRGPEIIPIYLGIKSNSVDLFAKNFIGVLLFQYLRIDDDSIQDDLGFLLEQAKEKIPKTIRLINQILKSLKEPGAQDKIYSDLLELPQLLYDETKKPILLILDEFHNLEQLGLKAPFIELSNKIMVQKYTMYILVSSAVFCAEHILSKKLSLLFGNFESIRMEPLDNKLAQTFIEQELQTLTSSANFKNFLVFFTGGYPFYLKVVLEQIRSLCLDAATKTVTERILVNSIIQTLYKDHGILNQFFNDKYKTLLEHNHAQIFTAILLAIAAGCKKPSRISSRLNKKPAEVNRHLNKLIQKDIITRRGVFYYINDPLFENWLKFVLSPRQNSFNIDISSAENEFTDEVKKLLNNFALESKKEIGERLKELFELFDNDIVELDKKRFMLTHFDHIDIKDINSATLLNARRLKKHWLCYIEKKFVDEALIGQFLDNVKTKDCIKKILIALEGIDVNARLKALEARTWIWDQNTLNELFSLFEKPRFIK